MPTLQDYMPSAVVLKVGAGPTTTEITQIEQLPVNPQFEALSLTPGGGVFPGLTGSFSSLPSFDFSSTQIKDILDFTTQDAIAKGVSATANAGELVDVEYRQSENLNTVYAIAAAKHVRLRAVEALVYWSAISAVRAQLATIETTVLAISDDGINAPVVQTVDTAITATPAVDSGFTLGPVKLNAGAFNDFICVDGWNLRSGATAKSKQCSGSGYFTFANVGKAAPEGTAESGDVSKVVQFLPKGASITSVDFFLRKVDQGGIVVADGTAEHIKITATAGTVKPGAINSLSFALHNLSVNTASAIA